MEDLISLDTVESLEEGFIVNINKFVGDVKSVVPNRTIIIDKYDFTIKEIIIYIMNGLYALKQESSVAWLAVYGKPYIVSLRKYAVPNVDDTIKVCNIVKDSLSYTISNDALDSLISPVLAEIYQGTFRYIK